MKARARGVLSHDPGVGVAHFIHGIGRQANQFRIKARDRRVVFCHALANLHQRVLDVPRMLIILQILGNFGVRERPSKPGVPPEKKRHEHDEPGNEEEQQPLLG